MTPQECRELYTKWLAEAMNAYHQLNMGGSVRVVVDQNGERVEYTAANRQSLLAWITRLQNALQQPDPCASLLGAPGKPAGFTF